MREHYAYEKLLVAVECLATGRSSLKERLEGAAISALVLLNSDDLPPEAREPFDRTMALLMKVAPINGEEGSFRVSLRHMSDEDAVAAAHGIVDAFILLDPKA